MSLLTQPADMAPITREAVAERLKGGKVDVANLVYKWTMLACLLVSLAVLVLLIWSVLGDGLEVLTDRGLDFLTYGNSGDSTTAGMWQAIYGSFFIALFVAVVAFPLGIAAAVYIEEYAVGHLVHQPDQRQHPQPGRGAVDRLRPARPDGLREDPRGLHRRPLDHRRRPDPGRAGPAHRDHHRGRGAAGRPRQHPRGRLRGRAPPAGRSSGATSCRTPRRGS